MSEQFSRRDLKPMSFFVLVEKAASCWHKPVMRALLERFLVLVLVFRLVTLIRDTHREKALSSKNPALTKSTNMVNLGLWYIKSTL